MVNFRSLTNRFVIMLLAALVGLVLVGTVLADADPTPGFPVVTEVQLQPTADVVATEVVAPVDTPADVPIVVERGISESLLIQAIGWLSAIIITLITVNGAVQGKSVHELAHSQPVQWGVTAAANLANLTPNKEDDAQIERLAAQLGYEVVREGGFVTLKPKSVDGSPPAAVPA